MARSPIALRRWRNSQLPAQSAPVPYARVGEDGVSYAGPARADVPAGPIRIVVFGPHAGHTRSCAGAAIAAHREGSAWELVPVASDQNWGAASTQLVHALWDQHALAIVTLDRDAAHLAEQFALKAFVPVVALSNDVALTSTNIPWIFRLPAETAPASAIRILQSAEARSGPNPQRLRDTLASGQSIAGMAFLTTGEPHSN